MSKSRIFLLPLILLLSACGEMPKLDTSSFDISNSHLVYRQDIRQGNFITQEMVSQLKPGLTREQVRYVLGTPLVTDPFHGNRWDYVALVYYPSLAAFTDMMTSADYESLSDPHRRNGCAEHVIVCTQEAYSKFKIG